MLLIISDSRKQARLISEMFFYMSILSHGISHAETFSEIYSKYRAILLVNPDESPDVNGYVAKIRKARSNLPIFAVIGTDETKCSPGIFDGIFKKDNFSPALAAKIISYANEQRGARLGDYRLMGLNASFDKYGIVYFFTRLPFTKTEGMILRYLIRSYPTPTNASNILKYAFKASRKPEAASVRTHISLINKKFRKIADRPLIIFEKGEGYLILTPEIAVKKNLL